MGQNRKNSPCGGGNSDTAFLKEEVYNIFKYYKGLGKTGYRKAGGFGQFFFFFQSF